jgi:outer membrane protein OmpA-like peptidoglycan-associated protein
VSESSPAESRPVAGDAGPATTPDELGRLRRLIFAAELDKLAEIDRRLSDPEARARDLGVVLDEALAVSIRKNRKRVAEALAPTMGPAIRRAIAETLRTMVESFNQVLQHSLSARALRWRFEAWRTGRPFAEVLLSHSLVYRVEQVYLVHRDTGLLLLHVAADAAAAQDADLVSGMLTAIRDFVRDSFSVAAEEAVDTMRVGDLTVAVEQGERAYLAAVVRGTPPANLRGVLRDALDGIQFELGEALDAFSGDAAPFEDARKHLEGCLQMQVAGKEERRSWLAPALVAGVVVAFLVGWLSLSLWTGRRWDAYVERLRAEPGIVVASEDGGVWRSSISGLADPYAADPVKLLADSGLDAGHVSSRWKPYVSQEPPVVLARARAVLAPPSTVSLSLAGGALSASGTAPHRWTVAAGVRALAIPGVLVFDTTRLVNEALAAMAPIQQRLESAVLRFDVGAAVPPPGEIAVLRQVTAALEQLAAVARESGVAVRIDVVGHTDGTGSEGTNVNLSRARAEWVLAALEAKGVRGLALAILGVGASRPLRPEDTDEHRSYNRSVTFHVVAGQ